jgi:hypothetical protein
MEARRTFGETAVSKKGFGVALMALLVAIVAILAISLASAGSAKPSSITTTPAIAPDTSVGSAALADRESGQPVGGYVEPANGHGALP